MFKTKKRVISLILAAMMVLSMVSVFAFAEDAPIAFDGSDGKGGYVCDVNDEDGNPEISSSALLVTNDITDAEISAGTLTRVWDGVSYTFTPNVNAFKTFDLAFAYATNNSISNPDIIVFSHSASTNLIIGMSCSIYGRNWNTKPFVVGDEATDAAFDAGTWKAINSDGAAWTENSVYNSQQSNVNNIIVNNTASGDVRVFGLTFNDDLFLGGNGTGLVRNNTSPAINFYFKNIKILFCCIKK